MINRTVTHSVLSVKKDNIMRFLIESLKASVATGVAVVGWLLLFVVPPLVLIEYVLPMVM